MMACEKHPATSHLSTLTSPMLPRPSFAFGFFAQLIKLCKPNCRQKVQLLQAQRIQTSAIHLLFWRYQVSHRPPEQRSTTFKIVQLLINLCQIEEYQTHNESVKCWNYWRTFCYSNRVSGTGVLAHTWDRSLTYCNQYVTNNVVLSCEDVCRYIRRFCHLQASMQVTVSWPPHIILIKHHQPRAATSISRNLAWWSEYSWHIHQNHSLQGINYLSQRPIIDVY